MQDTETGPAVLSVAVDIALLRARLAALKTGPVRPASSSSPVSVMQPSSSPRRWIDEDCMGTAASSEPTPPPPPLPAATMPSAPRKKSGEAKRGWRELEGLAAHGTPWVEGGAFGRPAAKSRRVVVDREADTATVVREDGEFAGACIRVGPRYQAPRLPRVQDAEAPATRDDVLRSERDVARDDGRGGLPFDKVHPVHGLMRRFFALPSRRQRETVLRDFERAILAAGGGEGAGRERDGA